MQAGQGGIQVDRASDAVRIGRAEDVAGDEDVGQAGDGEAGRRDRPGPEDDVRADGGQDQGRAQPGEGGWPAQVQPAQDQRRDQEVKQAVVIADREGRRGVTGDHVIEVRLDVEMQVLFRPVDQGRMRLHVLADYMSRLSGDAPPAT